MKLQNGFELEGNISTTMEKLNNIWMQVLIIESTLDTEQLRELFKDNNIIVDIIETIENTYNTGGLIDVKTQDNKNYVWLFFVNAISRESTQVVKNELQKSNTDLKASDSYLLKLSMLGITDVQVLQQTVIDLQQQINTLKAGV